MKIVALLDDFRHAHLLAYFYCDQFNEPKPVHFLVDTGCTTTTILSDDATRLGLNCSSLNSANPVSTANGNVVPYILPNIILMYNAYFGLFNLRNDFKGTRLDEIHCHAPTDPALMTRQKIANACSLLGMDFLKRFKKWKFTDKELLLRT
ncbi:MAG: retroviral-like aspartic protease family protein [Candidatus Bathyarchaeia archaeon]